MNNIIVALGVGVIAIGILTWAIPSIYNCGKCGKNIYWFQSRTWGMLDRYHFKCVRKSEGERI